MPEEKPIEFLTVNEHVEICHFDEDPDGEVDRAGDGYYFQVEGSEGWSGAWHSEEEAEDEAMEALALREWQFIVREMLETGFALTQSGGIDIFEKSIGDDKYLIRAEESLIVLGHENDGKYEVLRSVEVDEHEDGIRGTGFYHKAVREIKQQVLAFEQTEINSPKM